MHVVFLLGSLVLCRHQQAKVTAIFLEVKFSFRWDTHNLFYLLLYLTIWCPEGKISVTQENGWNAIEMYKRWRNLGHRPWSSFWLDAMVKKHVYLSVTQTIRRKKMHVSTQGFLLMFSWTITLQDITTLSRNKATLLSVLSTDMNVW